MQGVPELSTFPGSEPSGPVLMWLENGGGAIARGTAVELSRERARVKLTEVATLAPGDDVAVRVSFDRNTDTVAGEGRVLTIRANGDSPVCELEWTHTGPEREQLESLIAARS
jgi:hypothetical protein